MAAQSPIAAELLRPVLAPTLGTARTLPAEAYTSQAVFDWEVEHFFEGGWVCIGRADELAERRRPEGVPDRQGGHPRRPRHGREPPGLLQHVPAPWPRAAGAAAPRGTSRAIKCPYHAWVYQLDGSLGRRAAVRRARGLRQAEYPLVAAAHPGVARLGLRQRRRRRPPTSPSTSGNLDELVGRLGARAPVRGGAPTST